MAAMSIEGPLSKWTNVVKGWQYRWFVLDDNAGLLSYYTSKEKMTRGTRRGCVRLQGAVIGIDDEDDSTFTITVDGKIFHFQARDADERERWVRALEETILRHTLNRQQHGKSWDQSTVIPTVQNFDAKIQEADAFLKILIEQVRDLELKIERISDIREKRLLINIRDNANALLDTIKHTIVLLQIAKNTTHPVNGVYPQRKDKGNLSPVLKKSSGDTVQPVASKVSDAGLGILPPSSLPSHTTQTPVPPSTQPPMQQIPDKVLVSPAPPLQDKTALEATEQPPPSAPIRTNRVSISLPVPETSYSSSDDEDYFDAQEEGSVQPLAAQARKESLLSPLSHPPSASLVGAPGIEPSQHEIQKPPSPSASSTSAHRARAASRHSIGSNIDFDAVYQDDEEEELGNLENQKSVFSHILSQVRIGMDLTKVTLPTFILERRSLLEMYADFFAHPELFVRIPDYPEPKDRIVEMLRWYLSAFHAGRKSSVAKKPYNPILGEIFRCYWEIGHTQKKVGGHIVAKEHVKDGPIPWATKDDLTFIAEQVSHHPPISAFYAEHVNKGIFCSAHIWTKSKFLGMSIGVHNIGQGCVTFLKHDEEYLVNFPSGFGRAIFTVPWVELGGTVSITCAKTGYNASIQFHTKPFFGGKKHQITAEVFQPSDKKPFLTVTGEWNGVMTAKYANGNEEVFIDTTTLPIVKKIVKPVLEQEPNESRKLWKEVTYALRVKDVNMATENKFKLEQKQRDEAKERKDKGIQWKTRVFHETGEHWVFNNSLQVRLGIAAKE